MVFESDNYCHICLKSLSGRSQLYRHLREVHNNYERSIAYRDKDDSIFKCLEGCDISFRFGQELRFHLKTCHGLNATEQYRQFKNLEEFNKWFGALQEAGSRYIKPRGALKNGNKLSYYVCNRSGKPKTKTGIERKRRLKRYGSRKINAGCTSFVKLIELEEKCEVYYCEFHYGHKIELEHLPLSLSDRQEIVHKLANGAVLQKIDLDKDDIGPNILRSNILTKLDLKQLRVLEKEISKPRIDSPTNDIADSKEEIKIEVTNISQTIKVEDDDNNTVPMDTVDADSIDTCDSTFSNLEVIQIQYVDENGAEIPANRVIVTNCDENEFNNEDKHKNSFNDEEDFGLYVATMLKKMAPDLRSVAKGKIDNILRSYI